VATVIGLGFSGVVVWRENLVAVVAAHVLVNGVQFARLASRSEDPPRLDSSPIGTSELLHSDLQMLGEDPMTDTQDVLDRIDRELGQYRKELFEFLRIPSISTDPAYAPEVERCSRFIEGKMSEAGLTTRRIEGEGFPLVYGEWMGVPGAPTVLFYGHYDVQPVDPLEEWRHDPFEPTLEGDDIIARGATDDKGQSYTHLKAIGAMLAERGNLPVNVKILLEGEEESGGEAIEHYVRTDAGRELAADCVVVSDSSMYAPGQPSIVYGLRGMAYVEIRVQGPNRDLHSGSYGGAVANPLNAMAEIIARLKDPTTGRIQIPGFYDKVRDLEPWERQEMAELPFDEAEYRSELGIDAVAGEEGYSTLERVGIRPTCDVNGIFGGYQGRGAKTVLPAWGGAKISMRLVPDQDPDDIAARFTEFVQEVAPRGTRVEVTTVHGGPPSLLVTDGPYMDAAMEAMAATWGQRPVRVREGGSIPIVGTFSEVLNVPVLLLGYGLPDDRLHSPNEKFNQGQFADGIRCTARFLDRVGSLSS
jgi:acetylornithine deacetylase/succinyl-diaminopimelate desuccinylase-like protein